MRGDARKAGGRQGRYLRIPSWASLRCRKLPTPDPFASSVSIELEKHRPIPVDCLLYTSDAADDLPCVDLGGRRIIKKKNYTYLLCNPHT